MPSLGYLAVGAVQPGTSSGVSQGFVSIGAVQPLAPLTQASRAGIASTASVGIPSASPSVDVSAQLTLSATFGSPAASTSVVVSAGSRSSLVISGPSATTSVSAASGLASVLTAGNPLAAPAVTSQAGSPSALSFGSSSASPSVSVSGGTQSALMIGSLVSARIPSIGFLSIGAVQPGTTYAPGLSCLSIGAVQPSSLPIQVAVAGSSPVSAVGSPVVQASVSLTVGTGSTATAGSVVSVCSIIVTAGSSSTIRFGSPSASASVQTLAGIGSAAVVGSPYSQSLASVSVGIAAASRVGVPFTSCVVAAQSGVASGLTVGFPRIVQICKYIQYVSQSFPKATGATPVVPRNMAVNNLPIGRFVSIATGQEVTTGTVTGSFYTNAGSGSITGMATYDSTGKTWVWSQVPASTMNADMVGLSFSLDGCMPVFHLLSTEVSTYISSSVATGSISTTSFAGDSSLSSQGGFYVGSALLFTSGSLSGMARRISGYDGVTKILTFATLWPTVPALSDTFIIMGRIE